MTATLLMGVLAAALAQQKPQTDTTFAVRPGVRIEVETFGGEINVKTWTRNEVRVQATHGRRDVIQIESSGNSVHIEPDREFGMAGMVSFDITVPVSAALDLSGVNTDIAADGVTGDVKAETVAGDVKVTGGGRLELESVEGDIIVDKANGRMKLSTVNRGIHITNSSGDIEAETVNGPVVVQGVQSTHVDLQTMNGRVVYDGTIRPNGDYAISSHNGGIWIVVPADAGLEVSVSTFNGELESSFPVSVKDVQRRHDYSFTIGNGGAHLELESFGGAIHLRRPGESIPATFEPRPVSKPKIKIKGEDQP